MPLTTEVYASTVIGVPAYAASGAFTDTMGIKEFGQNSIVACCILETSMESTAIDTVRRIVLLLSNFESTVLRERLVSVDVSAQRTRVRMDYVPFGPGEAHRSPFGVEGTKKLKSASTIITVSEVTTNPNACFVDMATTLVIDVDATPNGALYGDDHTLFSLIETFWKQYLTRTISTLEEHLLSIAFPAVADAVENRLERDFSEVEDIVCEWSAKTTEHISRPDALQLLERSLLGWERARRELQHHKLITARLRADADGARAIAAAAAETAAAAMARPAAPAAPAGTDATPPPPPPPEPAPRARHRAETDAAAADGRKRNEATATATAAATTGIPFFEKGGGRTLSVSQDEHGSSYPPSQGQEQRATGGVLRSPPKTIDAKLIQGVVSRKSGTINENEAEALFTALDEAGEGFITAKEIARVLEHIDTLGLYEDRDGTIQQMAECRAAVGNGIFRHNGRPPSTANSRIAVEAASAALEPSGKSEETNGEKKLTPLQSIVRRHDIQKNLMHQELISKRSNELVANFSYKSRGKIHYDEFCLMMLRILGNC